MDAAASGILVVLHRDAAVEDLTLAYMAAWKSVSGSIGRDDGSLTCAAPPSWSGR